MNDSLVISADRYKYWHIDYQNGSIRIVCQDGQVLEEELEAKYRPTNSQVATSTFDWEKWWIWSTTTRNDLIVTEGFNPASPPPPSTVDRLSTSTRTTGAPSLTPSANRPE